jgi:diguanylate cyclase (GGDEF)-like protein
MLTKQFHSLADEVEELRSSADNLSHAEWSRQLVDENQLLRAVIDNFPGGLSLIDKNLKLVFCNDALKSMLDYPPALFEFGIPSLEQIFRFNATRGEYGPGAIEDLVRHRMELVRQRRAHAYERVRPNGMVLEVRGVPLEGGGFMTMYLDVSDRKAGGEPAHIGEVDKLTGLRKAGYIKTQIESAVARLRHGHVLAIHCLDLDHFKDVNAAHGRGAGDAILKVIAARLKNLLRDEDPVARIGGDRFLVLQPRVRRPADVAKLAHRMLDEIRRPIEIGGNALVVGSSIGFALAPRDGDAADMLIEKAQLAVIATKKRSRGAFENSALDWS